MSQQPRKLELLAPARTADIAIDAIRCGADAVYIGGPAHGARAAAANSIDDIARAVDYAHRFDARIYVTLNTLLRDDELAETEQLVRQLYRAGVDALIVQDMAILKLDIPPIALHASTQCDIRTPRRARFLEACGMSQIVIARELTLKETAEICRAVTVPVEAFVHGALCVSYSGACYASYACGGRSANRGECAQICRMPYKLTDSNDRTLMEGHLLSLRDLNRLDSLPELIDAGVSSFKIEGRLKDAAYVRNVTAAYRRRLDEIIAANPDRYCRASSARTELAFDPQLSKSFNRGFTDYFTRRRRPAAPMAAMRSPKWLGEAVATVEKPLAKGRAYALRLKPGVTINNGDGLGFFDQRGEFKGFGVNRAEGSTIYPATEIAIPTGTELLRNRDRQFDAMIAGDIARTLIPVDIAMTRCPGGITLEVRTGRSCVATFTPLQLEEARTPQSDRHRTILTKTGDTEFAVESVASDCDSLFIPASTLTVMRRDLIELLRSQIRATYRYDYRRPPLPAAELRELYDGYAANVANALARQFYADLGVTDIVPAPETRRAVEPGTRLMTTRYCLRREAGKCLRTPAGREWPADLTLRHAGASFKLEFDCANCEMHLLKSRS